MGFIAPRIGRLDAPFLLDGRARHFPWDPSTFVLIVTVLAATGTVACLVPARRATAVSPVVALRGR